MFKNQSVLVTGGTGSFGKEFVKTVLRDYPSVRRLVVFSRDELKQFEMAQEFSPQEYPQLRYFIGDVREKDRLVRAMEGIDYVVHAAALKQVPACEYNPFEAIKTNIIGAQNVVESAIESGVQRVVALSTDKAAAPVNLYGATKLCSDKLIVAANNMVGERNLRFSVVRYGNVMGSRGSVIPFFLKKAREGGVIPVTDLRMTRFNITLEQGVNQVLFALENMQGGEIFVPKIPSYRISDVVKAIAQDCEIEIIGIRPGEKLHEEMVTEMDALSTVEFDDYYVIKPVSSHRFTGNFWRKGTPCPDGFRYSSENNDRWLSVDQIRSLIREHVDPSFYV